MKKRLIYIIGLFLLLLSPVLSQAQIGYQYWIDDNMNAAVSGTTTDGAAISLTIDAAGLTSGMHFLNIRTGEGTKWGIFHRQLFAIPRDAQAASSGMKGYEYWIDNDYAHRMSATVSNSTEQAIEASIDVNNLSTGIHFFNMRVQDANGTWGSVQRQIFSIPCDQQAASSNLITGYRYGFGNDLTTVTLGSPVSEYKLTQQFDVTAPPVTTIDDDCHFSFDGSEATLLRNIEMTFALTFTDQAKAMSSPIGTTITLTDTQTSDILTLNVPGSLTIPAHASGGYTVMKFTIETATTYVLTSTTTCSLRLYSSEGAFIKTVKPELLAIGSLQDLETGTYYAVAYGNAAETSLSIALETPIVYTVATPVITHEDDVVTITTTTPDATIYYTVDGSIPTAESTLYTEPFTVTENGTIFAIAMRDGYQDSELALLEVDWIVVGTPCGYAIYDSETSTLTFKYGILPEGDNVWETENTPSNYSSKLPWYSFNQNILKVVFDASYAQARPTSTYGWFNGLNKLTKITGLEYLNTSQVTDMGYMFYNCSGLTSLDVSGFNTLNVTNMSSMFSKCSGLTSLNLSNFNTENVTSMGYMFSDSFRLTSLNLSNFNTENVTNMNYMFDGCSGLTSLNVSSFNTSKVKEMVYMFGSCYGLTSLNVSNFKTEKVTHMVGMFSECAGLTSLNVSNFNTENVTHMSYMFNGCSGLTTIYVGEGWTTEAVVSESNNMFKGCTSIVGGKGTKYNSSYTDKTYAHVDGGADNPGYLTMDKSHETCGYAIFDSSTGTLTFKYGIMPEGDNVWETDNTGTTVPSWSKSQIQNVVFESSYAQARPTSTYGWFSGLDNLTKITGLEYLNTSQVTDMGYMFNLCSSLTNLDVSNFNTSNVTNMERMFFRCSKLTSLNVSNFNTANVTNMSTMFCSCSGLTSLNLSNFNTSNVTNMGDMFESCSGLTSLNLSNFNTSNVTNMGFMFDGCSSLTILNVSSFNTKNVTNMRWMFYGCNKLTNLNVSNFDTGNVTNMDHMFYKCNSLTGLNVSNFNTANVTNMANMFAYCYVLTSLDVSNFDTSNVTDMKWMFTGCSKLTTLNVSNFNTAKVTNMHSMFYNCSGLTSLNVSNFDTSNVTDMGFMFSDCKKLTSLNVSHFNTSKVTNMVCMFQLCESLTSLDVSNFNTAKVTDMECMFNQCKGLKSLNVKNMNTGNVIYMSGMFSDCKGLTSLDLSSFDTHNVKFIGRYINEGRFSTNIGEYVGSGMFSNCSSLKTIYAGKGWSMESVTSDMELFAGCTNLVGGKGTTYNSSHIDKAYARIDGGTSAPGYFTEKPYILGDADGDGTVDVNDVTTTINHILGKPVANFVREAANIDGDESIDVNDVQGIIDIALGKRK